MFKTTKIESTIRPEVFESLNNGIWYYNYDIVEKIVTVRDITDDEEREELRYNYVQVRIKGYPTVAKCYEAILKTYKDENKTNLYEASRIDESFKDLTEEIYYNIKVDFNLEEELTPLEKAKKDKLKEIDTYDVSPEVNSFFLNGLQVWLDKSTRVGLMNSLNIEKIAGKEISTLWFANIKLNINTDAAIQMLRSLELYALECYNKTAEHKVNVKDLNTVEDVIDYDYTEGYPDKLNFSI